MNNKSITPNPRQPVDRLPAGQLPSALAELSEAALNHEVMPSHWELNEPDVYWVGCSYDGDDE
jgi:bacteriocin leader peptide (microcyclamide/patellamide family)